MSRLPSGQGRLALALATAVAGAAEAGAQAPPPNASLFKPPELGRVALNPTGSLVALQTLSPREQTLHVKASENAENSTPLLSTRGDLSFEWVDGDTILVQTREGDETRRFLIDLDPRRFLVDSELREITLIGWLVDPLPLEDDRLLWAEWDGKSSSVYRLTTDQVLSPTGQRGGALERALRPSSLPTPPGEEYRVARIRERVLYWISDRAGLPRAALVLADPDPVRLELLHRARAGERWRRIGAWSFGESFPTPVGIAPNGRDLLVVSAEGRSTAALHTYLVDEERLGEVVFADPEADVLGVVYAYQGYEITAAWYERSGNRRYHYFDTAEGALQAWLDRHHTGKSAYVTSRTADGRRVTILLTGPRDPGRYLLLDTESWQARELGELMPWLDPSLLAPVEAIHVRAKDGLGVEAFLASPRRNPGARPPPLVVMPHGGPIGVRDRRSFDPVLQSLAAQGYAVLQVNYRGSGGRGTAFLDAGKGAWGEAIEDDIEAAIDRVVAEGRVDPQRIGLFGFSYGGYSALIGITRHPLRYRCAAAVAAPTDLLLLFDSSDFAATEQGREQFAEIVGDPERDRERLVSLSPAYRAAEVEVPLLLVHGEADRRVDVEHAFRMRAMLEAHGKPYEWMVLPGVGHDPDADSLLAIVERVQGFLRQHLGPPGA